MRSNTQSVTIQAGAKDVFAFVADPATLPRWAIGFAKSISKKGAGWVVETGQGPVPIRYETDPDTGIIDFHMTPAPELEVVAHCRVVPNAEGSEFVFTQFQSPGMPDDVFEALVSALGHELVTLRALLEVDCPL